MRELKNKHTREAESDVDERSRVTQTMNERCDIGRRLSVTRGKDPSMGVNVDTMKKCTPFSW